MFLVLTIHFTLTVSYAFSCTNLLLRLSKLLIVFRIRIQTHSKVAQKVVGNVAPSCFHFLIVYCFSAPLSQSGWFLRFFLMVYCFSAPLSIPVRLVSPFLPHLPLFLRTSLYPSQDGFSVSWVNDGPVWLFLSFDNCWGIAICLGMLADLSEFFYSETHLSHTTLLSKENLSICLYRYFICIYLPYFEIHEKRNCVYVIHFSILRFY